MKNIYEYQDNFFEKENDRALLKYAKKIKNHDEKVFKSGRLQKKGWKVKCIVRRPQRGKKGKYQLVYRVWEKEIINELGEKEKIYKTPVYEKFNINKYEQIDKPLKLSYIEKSYDNMNYRQIRDYHPNTKISIRTIGSIINNFEKTFNFDLVKILESEVKEKVLVTKDLYIFIDDGRKKLKYEGKGRNYWIRSIKFCTGKKNGKLINKRWFTIHFPLKKKFSQLELYSLIMQKLNQFFTFDPKQVRLIFGSDGAKTFNKIKFLLSKTFSNFIFILDSYHFSENLNNNLGRKRDSKSIKIRLKKEFKKGNIENLRKILNTQIKKAPTEEKNKAFKAVLKYANNNSDGIVNQGLKENIGVSAESDISIVKELSGKKNKAYSDKTYRIILWLKEAEINKIDLFAIVKNQKWSEIKKKSIITSQVSKYHKNSSYINLNQQ